MKIIEFLRDHDEFGQEANFNIGKKRKFQTPLGGFLYFLVLAILFYKLLKGCLAYINKSDPDVMISESRNEEPIDFVENEEILKLTGFDNTIKMAGFTNKTYNLMDYFDVTSYRVKWNGTEPAEFLPLQIFPCPEEIEGFTYNRICVSSPKDQKINIYNDWSYYMSFILVRFKFCKTNNSSCKGGREGFWKFLKETENNNFIEVKLENKIYDPENFSNPLSDKYKNIYISNSKNILNTLHVDYKKNQVESDIGGIFNYVEITKNKEIEYYGNSIVYSEDITDESQYLRIAIKTSPIKRIYKRVYPFFGTWIEDAALLAGWVSVVVQFIYSFYNDYKYKWFMFKTIVNYEDESKIQKIQEMNETIDPMDPIEFSEFERKRNFSIESYKPRTSEKIEDKSKEKFAQEKSTENKEAKRGKSQELIDLDKDLGKKRSKLLEEINEESFNNFPIDNKEKGKFDWANSKLLFDTLTKRNKKKDFNYFTYILSSANIKKRKLFDLFEKICENYEKKFDVFYYLKKMERTELLKKILLEEKSEKLFNLISNKLYSSACFSQENKTKKNKIKSSEELLEIINSIDDSDSINRKLIDIISERLRNY